jgi:PEGA domain
MGIPAAFTSLAGALTAKRAGRFLSALVLAAPLLALPGCATMGLRAAVSFKVERAKGTPKDALVFIDGQYVATLGTVAKRGVRLPEGQHRIRVQKNGYHPFEALVVSDRQPIFLKVEMLELPD